MPRRSDVVLTVDVLRSMKRNETLRDAEVPGLNVWRGVTDWTWSYRWKDPKNGAQPKAKLGTYPAIPIDAARALARLERDRVSRGETPDAKIKAQRREQVAVAKASPAPTVGALWDDYRTRRLATSRKDAGRALDKLIKRDLGELAKVRADRATPEQAQALLESIVARGARSMAQQFREAMGAAWRYALQQRRLDRNIVCPFDGLMKDGGRDRLALVPKAERFRRDEWKAWLAWLPDSGISVAMQRAFMLQALTGARVGEILSARFDQIDADSAGRYWLRMFFKRAPRNIYLSAPAMRIVEQQRAANRGAEFLFPSERSASGHINPLNAVTCILSARDECPIKLRDPRSNKIVPWTSHTLRRSVKAGLTAELKVPHELSEIVIGHSIGTGTRASYDDESDYEAQIAVAMEKWGKLIASWSPRPALRAVST
jgi:integrase